MSNCERKSQLAGQNLLDQGKASPDCVDMFLYKSMRKLQYKMQHILQENKFRIVRVPSLKQFVLKSKLCVVQVGADQALISVNYSFSISRDVSISRPCKDTKINVSSLDPQIQNCSNWISRSSVYDSPYNSFDL